MQTDFEFVSYEYCICWAFNYFNFFDSTDENEQQQHNIILNYSMSKVISCQQASVYNSIGRE